METFMTQFARVAIAALILISAGCAPMGANTSSSGDSAGGADSSIYRGGAEHN